MPASKTLRPSLQALFLTPEGKRNPAGIAAVRATREYAVAMFQETVQAGQTEQVTENGITREYIEERAAEVSSRRSTPIARVISGTGVALAVAGLISVVRGAFGMEQAPTQAAHDDASWQVTGGILVAGAGGLAILLSADHLVRVESLNKLAKAYGRTITAEARAIGALQVLYPEKSDEELRKELVVLAQDVRDSDGAVLSCLRASDPRSEVSFEQTVAKHSAEPTQGRTAA